MTYLKKKNKVKKFRKKFNTRRIKSKKSYSIEETGILLNIHTNTVGAWFKEGLPKIDSQLPYLIFGQDLIDFLNARNAGKKRPCDPDEFFCCKCQEPQKSKNNSICIKIDTCRTNIVGICQACGTKINKAISPQKVDFYKKIFTAVRMHTENLIECTSNCAITKEK